MSFFTKKPRGKTYGYQPELAPKLPPGRRFAALRILHVGNHTTPCVGGIEKVIWDVARTQAKMGHTVHVLVFDACTNGGKLPARETKEGVEIHRIPCRRFFFYRKPAWGDMKSIVADAHVVHVHGFGGWLDELTRHRNEFAGKLFLTTHGGFFHTSKRMVWKKLYEWFMLSRIWNAIDGVSYVSENDKRHFHPPSTVIARVISNGVELAPLHKLSLASKKKTNFVFVGRLSRNKGIDCLIHVFGKLVDQNPDFQLHIIGEDWEGDGPAFDALIKEKKMVKNIWLHGKLPDATVRKWYSECAFFISASKYEGFGISAVEAMGAGCIPILNRIPTFEQFVADSHAGVCVDFESPDAASAIRKYVENPSSLKPAFGRARDYSRSFDLRKIAEQYIQLYRDAGAV